MPKLMLLTVADPPNKPCELQVSVGDDDGYHDEKHQPRSPILDNNGERQPPQPPQQIRSSASSSFTSKVESWLSTESGRLDGVYLQYEAGMKTDRGAGALRRLRRDHGYLVGIWGYSGQDPDNYETAEWLVREGECAFVNTDLPNHFCKHVSVRM